MFPPISHYITYIQPYKLRFAIVAVTVCFPLKFRNLRGLCAWTYCFAHQSSVLDWTKIIFDSIKNQWQLDINFEWSDIDRIMHQFADCTNDIAMIVYRFMSPLFLLTNPINWTPSKWPFIQNIRIYLVKTCYNTRGINVVISTPVIGVRAERAARFLFKERWN